MASGSNMVDNDTVTVRQVDRPEPQISYSTLPSRYVGSYTARSLDEADGVRDGKYFGRDILVRRAPASAQILDDVEKYYEGESVNRRVLSRAEILDDVDGVRDGKYYGREIVTRRVPSAAQVLDDGKYYGREIATRRKVDRYDDTQMGMESLLMENEDLREKLVRMKDRYNNLAFNAAHVRRDAAMLRRLTAENKALRADYDIMLHKCGPRDKLQEDNKLLQHELQESRVMISELRRQRVQPCRNCGILNAEIASLQRRITELEADNYGLKHKPFAAAKPTAELHQMRKGAMRDEGKELFLRRLIQLDEHHEANSELLDELWYSVDVDRNGVLEGREFQRFINTVADYMEEDLASTGHEMSRETIMKMLHTVIDRDGDMRVDKNEFYENLKMVLDSCESQL